MIKFGLGKMDNLEVDDWAKHHKQISIHVKREFPNGGEVIETEDEKILKVIKENEDRVLKQQRTTFNRETFESKEVLDYFLVLDNKDYIETDIEHYGIGASNTKQVSYIRLFFKIDYNDFILDYSYKTKGSMATSFYDLIDGNGIEEIINEIAGSEGHISDKGIEYNESDDGDYYIIGIDRYKKPIEFEISSHELLNSLVSVEMYKHDMEIINNIKR